MNWNHPTVLLDQDTSTGSGGAPAPASSAPPAGGGGAGGAPSPAPAREQIARIPDSPDEPGGAEGAHDAFAGMEDNEFDLVEVPIEAPTGGEPGAAPQPQPQGAQPAQPAPATAPAPGAPQAQPAQAAPAAPQQNVPQQPRSALDQAIDGFRTNHKELSTWASTNLFALTKEDADLLETDAVAAIPQLMGRVYSQALQATVNLMKNFVPNMINEGVATTTARSAKAQEALNEFYTSNPHLNPAQHGAAVDKWARAYRAANPAASRADAIKFVGNAVSAEFGVNPAAPAGANGAARRPAPFAPARPGTRVQQPTPQHDPYEGMDMEFDQ